MSIKRYNLDGPYAVLSDESNYLLPNPDGEWVRWSDVQPLLDLVEALQRRGGLGIDVHERIEAVLAGIGKR